MFSKANHRSFLGRAAAEFAVAMNQESTRLRYSGGLGLCAFLLLGLPGLALAQTVTPSFGFDTSNSLAAWQVYFGHPNPTLEWDSASDSRSNSASGSLRITQRFTGAPMEFFAANGLFLDSSNNPVTLDGTRYYHIAVDLAVAAGTAPSTNRDFGMLEIGAVSPGWNHISLGSFFLPLTATNWTRFLVPITPPGLTNISSITGLYVQVGSWFGSLTNTLTVNFDNLELGGGVCCAPPPYLKLEPAIPGPGFILSWTTPSQGYRVQATSASRPGDWYDTGLETNAIPAGGMMRVMVPADTLPDPSAGFWRLRRPQP